ncbi:MAG: glycoside hydrolase family 92 protein [Leadbetterella sp.]|nr:glycoside hydrolase family 92 protein [Leadbetterella sp.]
MNDTLFVGERFSTGWSKDQRVFFALKTSVPVSRAEFYEDTIAVAGQVATGKATRALLFPRLEKGRDELLVKVALSPVSAENALLNMDTEVPHWNFDKLRSEARNTWNDHLSRIEIDAADSVKTLFYTAMYHTRIAPTLFNDVNGDYRGSDKLVYRNPGFQNYTTFSLWDTYRGLQPLLTLTDPERSEDFVRSLVSITGQQNALAMWPLQGSETFCMIGNPAMTVIADAFHKGLLKKETALNAFEAVYKVSNHPTEDELPIGQKWVRDLKWIPADKRYETVAWGMEYAVADAAFAGMARGLGKEDAARYYEQRGKLYEAYFDRKKGFFNGRYADGSFRKDFDPFNADHRTNDFVEGNAWQYLWMVPHQPHELIRLLGGEEAFTRRLDEFFSLPSTLDASASSDITGLIGQYAHGNEPSHHIAYLYTFAGKPWKTAEIVREVTGKFYTTKPDGLIGNEDAGQMSAWYVLSALGFYPANPVSGEFVFGSPLVNSATIRVKDNKTFRIIVRNNNKENKYIRSVRLNDKDYEKSYITYEEIMKGGTLEFILDNKPSEAYTRAKRPQ